MINFFYYNVEVVSNETKIILEWTIGSEKKTQELQINSIMRVRNELRTSVPQPPGVLFRAYAVDDQSQLMINNDDADAEVMPSTSKEEFTVLEVTRSKGMYFYHLLCQCKRDLSVQNCFFCKFVTLLADTTLIYWLNIHFLLKITRGQWS